MGTLSHIPKVMIIYFTREQAENNMDTWYSVQLEILKEPNSVTQSDIELSMRWLQPILVWVIKLIYLLIED